ncbi:MAG TPA: hypothetical protein VFU81_02395 [Thermomicrobiales bacterium]|nr:hypothetical protein [Thermomicrobiales bacterium]
MPVYQATFRHPADPARQTTRRIAAATLVKASFVAAQLASSGPAAEGWGDEPPDLVEMILAPDDPPGVGEPGTGHDLSPRHGPPPTTDHARVRARDFARAAALAADPAQAIRLLRAVCAIAGIHP